MGWGEEKPHKDKSALTVKEILQKAFAKAGIKPQIVRSDGAGEYEEEELNKWLTAIGVHHQYSAVDSQYQNALAEKFLDTLGNGPVSARSCSKAIFLRNFGGWQLFTLSRPTMCYPTLELTTRSPWKNIRVDRLTFHGSNPSGVGLRSIVARITSIITRSRRKASLECLLDLGQLTTKRPGWSTASVSIEFLHHRMFSLTKLSSHYTLWINVCTATTIQTLYKNIGLPISM
eukprot:3937528-Rhodomonas_salina.3